MRGVSVLREGRGGDSQRGFGNRKESPASWEIEHVFEASDKNRDGFVTAQELKEGLASLGCEISDQQLAKLMRGQQTLRRAEHPCSSRPKMYQITSFLFLWL